jgi:hypothetical protein
VQLAGFLRLAVDMHLQFFVVWLVLKSLEIMLQFKDSGDLTEISQPVGFPHMAAD